jgi:hypothetical protein
MYPQQIIQQQQQQRPTPASTPNNSMIQSPLAQSPTTTSGGGGGHVASPVIATPTYAPTHMGMPIFDKYNVTYIHWIDYSGCVDFQFKILKFI